jgi:uncharacterized protein (DUF58 family)
MMGWLRRLDPFRFSRILWRSWRDEVTTGGKWVVAVSLTAALGTVSVQAPIYQVFCGLTALFLTAMFSGFFVSPNVTFSGRLPEKTTAGVPLTGEITITNRSLRPALDVSIGFFSLPSSIRQLDADRTLATLGRRESTTLPVTLLPTRRGQYELPPLRSYTTFPFHLFRIGNMRHEVDPLLVLPAFHPLESLSIPLATLYQPGGIALTSRVGESMEYIGNREYIPGEPARRLDFRSWARLGRPVVREFQEEYYCRVALILDTQLSSWSKNDSLFGAQWSGFKQGWNDADSPAFEAAVSMTAAVAESLSHGEYIIDLFAAGPDLHVFRSGRHTAHFENVLELLACVGTSSVDPVDTLLPALSEELASVSTAVCVLLDWDVSRRRLVQAIRDVGCELKVVIVRDNETTLPVDPGDAEFVCVSSTEVQSGEVVEL